MILRARRFYCGAALLRVRRVSSAPAPAALLGSKRALVSASGGFRGCFDWLGFAFFFFLPLWRVQLSRRKDELPTWRDAGRARSR